MTFALQNMQFLQYFSTKFYIFSLNLTGESDVFVLFISTHSKLSMGGFKLDLNDQIFCCVELYGLKIFIFVVSCTQMSSQTLSFYTFLSI